MSTPKTVFSVDKHIHTSDKHIYLQVPSAEIGKSLEVWGFSNSIASKNDKPIAGSIASLEQQQKKSRL
jgi:hypothetical protein